MPWLVFTGKLSIEDPLDDEATDCRADNKLLEVTVGRVGPALTGLLGPLLCRAPLRVAVASPTVRLDIGGKGCCWLDKLLELLLEEPSDSVLVMET